MKIREELKIGFDELVVFKEHFDFNGLKCNAVIQTSDAGLIFLDTDNYHAPAEIEEELEKTLENIHAKNKGELRWQKTHH